MVYEWFEYDALNPKTKRRRAWILSLHVLLLLGEHPAVYWLSNGGKVKLLKVQQREPNVLGDMNWFLIEWGQGPQEWTCECNLMPDAEAIRHCNQRYQHSYLK